MAGISPQIKRGSAELAILALLDEQSRHGYELAKRIEQQTYGVLRFDMASLYPMLYRLERRGWIRGHWREMANGRRRRLYALTATGRRKLAPLREQWRMFVLALDEIAGVGGA